MIFKNKIEDMPILLKDILNNFKIKYIFASQEVLSYIPEDYKIFKTTQNNINEIKKEIQITEYNKLVININDFLNLQMNHIISSAIFLEQNVKYFSMSDIIKNCLLKPDIIGSFAYDLYNFAQKDIDSNSLCINLPIKSTHSMNIIGNNKKTDNKNKDFEYFLSFDEFFPFLNKHNHSNFKLILGAKILSSSFFLNEFIDMFGYVFEIPMISNSYFNNFNDLKNFMSAIGYIDFFSSMESQSSFSNAIIYLKNKFQILEYQLIPYVVFKQEQLFCNKAIIFQENENLNSNMYFIEDTIINQQDPFERIITLEGEKSGLFSSLYEFYMQEILGFKRKSINSLIIKNLYDAVTSNSEINKSLLLNYESIEFFIEKIKKCVEIVDNKLFHKHIIMFFALSHYQVNRIKTYARNKLIYHIYVANFKTFTIEEYKMRKSYLKKQVILKY